jgi:hypothetical protein
MALTSDDIDLRLMNVVLDELGWTSSIDSSAMRVSVTDGAVTLSAEVRTYPQKLVAVEAVRRVYGVIALIDEIVVAKGVPSPCDADVRPGGRCTSASCRACADTMIKAPEMTLAAGQRRRRY